MKSTLLGAVWSAHLLSGVAESVELPSVKLTEIDEEKSKGALNRLIDAETFQVVQKKARGKPRRGTTGRKNLKEGRRQTKGEAVGSQQGVSKHGGPLQPQSSNHRPHSGQAGPQTGVATAPNNGGNGRPGHARGSGGGPQGNPPGQHSRPPPAAATSGPPPANVKATGRNPPAFTGRNDDYYYYYYYDYDYYDTSYHAPSHESENYYFYQPSSGSSDSYDDYHYYYYYYDHYDVIDREYTIRLEAFQDSRFLADPINVDDGMQDEFIPGTVYLYNDAPIQHLDFVDSGSLLGIVQGTCTRTDRESNPSSMFYTGEAVCYFTYEVLDGSSVVAAFTAEGTVDNSFDGSTLTVTGGLGELEGASGIVHLQAAMLDTSSSPPTVIADGSLDFLAAVDGYVMQAELYVSFDASLPEGGGGIPMNPGPEEPGAPSNPPTEEGGDDSGEEGSEEDGDEGSEEDDEGSEEDDEGSEEDEEEGSEEDEEEGSEEDDEGSEEEGEETEPLSTVRCLPDPTEYCDCSFDCEMFTERCDCDEGKAPNCCNIGGR